MNHNAAKRKGDGIQFLLLWILFGPFGAVMSFLLLCWINALEVFLRIGSADVYKLLCNTRLKSKCLLKIISSKLFYAKPNILKNAT